MAVTGVKAVVVRQKEPLEGSTTRLSVAEIKIFVGDEEVSSSADCFSFPKESYLGNMDKVTGAQWRLNDGDLDTYSLSGDWNAAVQNYGIHRNVSDRHTDRHARTHALAHTHTHTRTNTHAHTRFV